MSECIDQQIGQKLHAYELSILSDDDLAEFEEHLIACEHCRRQATAFDTSAALIRTDPDAKNIIDRARAQSVSETAAESKAPVRLWKRIPWAIAAVLAFLILYNWDIEFRPSDEAQAYPDLLAVMYFEDLADRTDSLRWGRIASDLLINDLSESKYLSVLSSHRIYDILKQIDPSGGATVTPEIATAVATKGQARWILTGAVLQHEPNVILTSQLAEVATGRVMSSQRVDGAPRETILQVIDRLTKQLKSDLALPQQAIDEYDPPVGAITTTSMEAYRLYLTATDHIFRYNWIEARDLLEQVVKLDSTFAMAWYRLRECRLQDPNGQHEALRHAIANIDRATEVQQLYIRARAMDNLNEAIELYNRIIDNYPQEKEAYIHLGSMYVLANDRTKAIESYQSVLALDPGYTRAYRRLAHLYGQMLDFVPALTMAERYTELSPDDADSYHTKAKMLSWSGKPREAIEWYKKALAIDPDRPHTLDRLSAMYLLVGDFQKADSVARSQINSRDSLSRWYGKFRRSQDFRLQGRIREAIAEMTEVIDEMRQVLGPCGPLGGAIFDRSFLNAYFGIDCESALEDALEVISMYADQRKEGQLPHPNGLGNYFVNALLCGKEELADSLKQVFEASVAARNIPRDEMYLFWIGQYEYLKGNYTKAVECQEPVMKIAVTYTTLHHLARVYYGAGRLADAVKAYEATVNWYDVNRAKYGELSALAVYELGMAYEASGWNDRATARYEEFLDLWKNADSTFPQLQDAKDRLNRLSNPN